MQFRGGCLRSAAKPEKKTRNTQAYISLVLLYSHRIVLSTWVQAKEFVRESARPLRKASHALVVAMHRHSRRCWRTRGCHNETIPPEGGFSLTHHTRSQSAHRWIVLNSLS